MEEKKDDLSSHLRWFRNRNRKSFSNNHELPRMNKQDGKEEEQRSSPIFSSWTSSASTSWLKTTLSDLDEKTQAMLKLIEEDAADSFAKRAEMYYKRRPQLIEMVHDFHRAHCSLAERYQLVMSKKNYSSDTTTPATSYCEPPSTTSPSSSSSSSSEDVDIKSDYPNSCSSFYATDDSSSTSSEVPDIDEDQQQLQRGSETASTADEHSFGNDHEEVILVPRKDMQSLMEENKKLKEQMMQKDEEKREAIRQLCFSMDLLREEHVNLMAIIMKKTRQNHATRNNELDTLDHPEMFMLWRRLFLNL